jgi:hypothetical protein
MVAEDSDEATVENIGCHLRDFEVDMSNSLSWASMLKVGHGFGEIRAADGFRRLPKNHEIRVVLLRDPKGLVLRWWCDTELEQSIARLSDDKLRSSGDDRLALERLEAKYQSRIVTHYLLATYKPLTVGELRSGYIAVKGHDTGDLDVMVYGCGGRKTFRVASRGISAFDDLLST